MTAKGIRPEMREERREEKSLPLPLREGVGGGGGANGELRSVPLLTLPRPLPQGEGRA
jgi:hypothetical protein